MQSLMAGLLTGLLAGWLSVYLDSEAFGPGLTPTNSISCTSPQRSIEPECRLGTNAMSGVGRDGAPDMGTAWRFSKSIYPGHQGCTPHGHTAALLGKQRLISCIGDFAAWV